MTELVVDQAMGGIAAAVVAIGIAAVELVLRFRERKTWRDDVLKEVEIYRYLEQTKNPDRTTMRRLGASIQSRLERELSREDRPVPFWKRVVVNCSMLLSSLVIGACVLGVAAIFGVLSGDVVVSVVLLVGASAGVEAVISLASMFKGQG